MEKKGKQFPSTREAWEHYADFCSDNAEEVAIAEFNTQGNDERHSI